MSWLVAMELLPVNFFFKQVACCSSASTALQTKVLESLQPADLRNARYAMFGQCVMDLIEVLLVLMRYPEDVDQLSEDEVTREALL